MQRWHLTLGLTGLAIAAALLAPRLAALRNAGPVTHPPAPAVPSSADPVPSQVDLPPVSDVPPGHLVVAAGLDRTAVLAGGSSERFLTVTVTAPSVGPEVRRPVDLSVVLDASGSMSARGKIDQARRAAKMLASQMQPGDTYSLVVFNDDASVAVPATGVEDVGAIHRAIDRIYEGGGTNLYAGIDRGAREVRTSLRDGAVGRVVVLSDGNANVGVTDPGALSRFAGELSANGVALSAVGLGLDYNEDLLAALADLGGGTYHYVNDASQLSTVFSDELARTASVVARNTKVHVDLPPDVTPLEVIGWTAVPAGHGWDVFMGDVYGGETRKIVARVQVTGEGAGTRAAATATADYHDVVDARPARNDARAVVTVTTDPAVVAASVDRRRAVEATQALGSWYLDLSTRAYEAGDSRRMRELATQGAAILRQEAASLGDTKLDREADELNQAMQVFEMHAPSSEAGRHAIKFNKETARDDAR